MYNDMHFMIDFNIKKIKHVKDVVKILLTPVNIFSCGNVTAINIYII